MGKEILTIQLGQKANYLATHFWNSQEANFEYAESSDKPIIDNDVNFRAGIGQEGVETYAPRTLIYDLKGGFGSLRKYNELYEAYSDVLEPEWEGTVQKYNEPEVAVHPYQTALNAGDDEQVLSNEKVRWWSDFNRVYYHPRSAIQLNQYQLDISPFASFTQGRDLFRDVDKVHMNATILIQDDEILDRDVRPFAEESDSLQGFQILLDSHSSWAGFGAEYLDVLREEFPKASIWTWGIEPHATNAAERLSFTQLLSSIYENTTLYIPLHSPHHIPFYISIDTSSLWHSSALFSLAYDSITLPTRTKKEHPFAMDMYDLALRINVHGHRKIVEPEVTVLIEQPELSNRLTFGWPSVTGERGLTSNVLRGEYRGDIDVLTKMLSQGNIVTERIIHPQFLTLPSSFPKIFASNVNAHSISTFSALSSNPATVRARLGEVKEETRRLAPLEEREELYNSIAEISGYYEEDDGLEGI